MSVPRWVRGRALQAVIGLGEIKPGDELRVKLNDHAHPAYMRDETACNMAKNTVLTVTEVFPLDRDLDGGLPCMSRGGLWICGSFPQKVDGRNWGFCVHEIVAWRRPCPKSG